MSESDIILGLGLVVSLAVACQVVASRLRIPAIILLLPVGFLTGIVAPTINPDNIFGSSFGPMVGFGVAIILFEGGLDLRFSELEGRHHRCVRRLITVGVPLTWFGATVLAALLLGMSSRAAVLLGAILIVSGPTVVGPLLSYARPNGVVRRILSWESSSIDPIGAIIAALVFTAITTGHYTHVGEQVVGFLLSVGVGLAGAAAGTLLLWFLLNKLELGGVLGTEAMVAAVILVTAVCNVIRPDTGLLAAIVMGIALANITDIHVSSDRAFLSTTVQLIIGVLFVSISATVSPESLPDVLLPAVGVVAGLVLVVRPVVAWVSTMGAGLSWRERAFIGWMDPRGIVAASTASTFAAPLVESGIGGAEKLLPTTFLVIVGTVAVYGLSATAVARWLKVTEDDVGPGQAPSPPAPSSASA